MIVVLGLNQPSRLHIITQTFRKGDPSFAGPLAGVALNLPCYHILELKDEIPEDVWQKEMTMLELEMEETSLQAILQTMQEARQD